MGDVDLFNVHVALFQLQKKIREIKKASGGWCGRCGCARGPEGHQKRSHGPYVAPGCRPSDGPSCSIYLHHT